MDLLNFQDIPDFLIWGTCSRNLNRNLLKVGDRLRKMEGEQRKSEMGKRRARLEAKDGSFFGEEDALLPTLCKQFGPRNLWMFLCTVVSHLFTSFLVPTLSLTLS